MPVVRAEYQWGKSTRCFFIFGNESVHAPGYPVSIVRLSLLAGTLAALGAGAGLFISRDLANAGRGHVEDTSREVDTETAAPQLATQDGLDAAWAARDASTFDARDSIVEQAPIDSPGPDAPRDGGGSGGTPREGPRSRRGRARGR